MKKIFFVLYFSFLISESFSQKADTIIIDASNINTKVLIPGTHQWLVYLKNGKDSSRVKYSFWTRKIDFILYKNKRAISVTQEWEDNDTIIHKSFAVCDPKTFSPLYHESWWKSRGSSKSDFLEKQLYINGTLVSESDTAKNKKNALVAFRQALYEYVLDWHLDLEVFPTLPYRKDVTFLINFYDSGLRAPRKVAYTVIGSDKLAGYENSKIDCWILQQKGKISTETFWISKKTNEVLKMEQEYNGTFRYKIKIPFRNS